jgi:hypothetical protein
VTHHYNDAGVSIGHDARGLLPAGEGRVIGDDVLADRGQPQQHAVPSILISHLQIEVVVVLRDKDRSEQDSRASCAEKQLDLQGFYDMGALYLAALGTLHVTC